MENALNITSINDFIFCPASIYFHYMYGEMDDFLYQDKEQINGKNCHKSVDTNQYTGPASLQGLYVYCEKYNLIGKIDIYEKSTFTLIERKKKVKKIYDGYVFQLYAQYFAMQEMGYKIEKLKIRSIDDNKTYNISLPKDDISMFNKFEKTIKDINTFDLESFSQNNIEKCKHCIYAPYCDKEVTQ